MALYGDWDIFGKLASGYASGQAIARQNALVQQQMEQNRLAAQQEQNLRNALVRAYTPQTRTIENSAYMSPEEIAQTIDPMAQHEARNALLTPGQTELTPEQIPQYTPLYQQKRNELLGQVREAGYDVPLRTEVVPFQPKTYGEIVASKEMAKQYQTIYAPMLERFIAPESFSREGIQQIADIYRQSGNPELMRMADTLVTIRPSSKEGEFNYVLPAVTTDDEAAQFAQQYPDLAARFGSRGVIRNIPLRITENMNGDVVGMSLEKLPSEAKPEMLPREFPATPAGISALRSLIAPTDVDALAQLTAIEPSAGTTLSAKKDPQTGKTYITISGQAGPTALQERTLALAERRLALLEENAARAADPDLQARLAEARATGTAIAKGDVAAVQALPKILARAETAIANIDALIGKRDEQGRLLKGQRPHPGFSSAVGATLIPGARFVPGSDTADFNIRLNQVKGTSFLEAFESLKGGGSITEIEGTKATEAINRMSLAQSEKEFIDSATELRGIIQKGVRDAKEKAAKASKTGTKIPTFEEYKQEHPELTPAQQRLGYDTVIRRMKGR